MRSKNTTKQSLLSAGAQEFSLVGYQKARIVEICRSAGTNPASINYYFGSKSNFYLAVWEHLMSKTELKTTFECKQHPSAGECRMILKDWMLDHFRSNIKKNRAFRLRSVLINREISEPSEMFQEICDRFLAKHALWLEKLIAGMNGREPDPVDSKVRLFSLIANFTFYMNHSSVEQYYLKQKNFQEENVEQIVETLLRMLEDK